MDILKTKYNGFLPNEYILDQQQETSKYGEY